MQAQNESKSEDTEPPDTHTHVVNTDRIDEIAKETNAENSKQQPGDVQPRKVTSLYFGALLRFVHCFALLSPLT